MIISVFLIRGFDTYCMEKMKVSGAKEVRQRAKSSTLEFPFQGMPEITSPDGKMRLAQISDTSISLIDKATGKKLFQLDLKAEIRGLKFSPDSKLFCIKSAKNECVMHEFTLWDSSTGTDLLTEQLKGDFKHIHFSHDSKIFLAQSSDKKIILWNIATGKLCLPIIDITHEFSGDFKGVHFSPNSGIVCIISKDNEMGLWDLTMGKKCKPILIRVDEVKQPMFSPDSTMICILSTDQITCLGDLDSATDKIISLWNVAEASLILQIPIRAAKLGRVLFSPDSTMLFVRSLAITDYSMITKYSDRGPFDDKISGWKIASKKEFIQIPLAEAEVKNILFSSDSTMLFTRFTDEKEEAKNDFIRVWNLITGKELIKRVSVTNVFEKSSVKKSSEKEKNESENTAQSRSEEDGPIKYLVVSPDSSKVCNLSKDNEISLWDTTTGEKCKSILVRVDECKQPMFSPDSAMLCIVTTDQIACLWDLDSAAGKIIGLWDIATAQILLQISVGATRLGRIAFSPDSTLFFVESFTTAYDGKISCWNIDTEKEYIQIPFGKSEIKSLTFSSDNKLLYLKYTDGKEATQDEIVRCWSLVKGTEFIKRTSSNVFGESRLRRVSQEKSKECESPANVPWKRGSEEARPKNNSEVRMSNNRIVNRALLQVEDTQDREKSLMDDIASSEDDTHETAEDKQLSALTRGSGKNARPRILSGARMSNKRIFSGTVLQGENTHNTEKLLIDDISSSENDKHRAAKDKRSNIPWKRWSGGNRPRTNSGSRESNKTISGEALLQSENIQSREKPLVEDISYSLTSEEGIS